MLFLEQTLTKVGKKHSHIMYTHSKTSQSFISKAMGHASSIENDNTVEFIIYSKVRKHKQRL